MDDDLRFYGATGWDSVPSQRSAARLSKDTAKDGVAGVRALGGDECYFSGVGGREISFYLRIVMGQSAGWSLLTMRDENSGGN
jgi:hypothetical protein